MRNLVVVLALSLSLCPALARAQTPPVALAPLPVSHVPANQTHEGRLVLAFRVPAIDAIGSVAVYFRQHDARAWRRAVAQRSAEGGPDGWLVEIPRDALVPPSVDYYVVTRRGGVETPVFASASSPHPVVVVETDSQWHERDSLRLTNGHRSRVTLGGEWIDYGSRQLPVASGGTALFVDRYFRGEASYAYGMFDNVEWLRFSLGVLRGNAGQEGAPNEVGLYYGTSEITWYALSWLRLRTQILFGISQYGFELGGRGAIVFGREGDTQVTIEGGGVTRVGATGSVRLSWHTVPHIPMAAVVEVSSLPGGGDAGVRMLVEAGFEIEPGTVLRLWGGYQARTQVVGGPTVGAELVLGL